ncbi:DUF4983 domain-containing protein [Niabella sp.]|uniref:DUF4983 domain-containing protein n=1 Tax=Niabella sp. TaxID=1962976 RepID=UPI00260D3038|nr:DUF4983 domain-containing protein [Niabella sp.]
MQNNQRNKKIKSGVTLAVMAAFLSLYAIMSCNRTFPEQGNQLRTDYPDSAQGTALNRKVLYLILDGAEGKQIQALNPPNIRSLLANGVYSWVGVSGGLPPDSTLPATWTNMMTGIPTDKTNVGADFQSANFSQFPTFISRIKTMAAGTRTAGFAASALFSQYLLKDATVNTLTENNDEQVTQNVMGELGKPDATIVVGQFHSIAAAGDRYGYLAATTEYSNAVTTVDNYIGAILATLKKRPGYKQENWLVVVASNLNGAVNKYAGTAAAATYFGDSRRNNFVIFSSPRFKALQVNPNGAPVSTAGYVNYIDSVLQLQGAGANQVRVYGNDDKHVFDLVKGTQRTLEFKLKVPATNYKTEIGGQGFYNLFGTLRAQTNNDNQAAGWHIMTCAGWCNNTKLFINFATADRHDEGNNGQYDAERPGDDGQWHNIALVINWPANSNLIKFKFYMDGTLRTINDRQGSRATTEGEYDAGNATSIVSKGKFYIGPPTDALPQMNIYSDNCYITDLRYWNVAFTDADVAKYSCKSYIPDDHPYLDKLAAYYKLNKLSGNAIKDLSPTGQDAIVVDPSKRANFTTFNETAKGVCPDPNGNFYKATITGLDVPMLIYQWMGFGTPNSWGLGGRIWSTGYTDVVPPQ